MLGACLVARCSSTDTQQVSHDSQSRSQQWGAYDAEPMSDKQTRYSRVNIMESSPPARLCTGAMRWPTFSIVAHIRTRSPGVPARRINDRGLRHESRGPLRDRRRRFHSGRPEGLHRTGRGPQGGPLRPITRRLRDSGRRRVGSWELRPKDASARKAAVASLWTRAPQSSERADSSGPAVAVKRASGAPCGRLLAESRKVPV